MVKAEIAEKSGVRRWGWVAVVGVIGVLLSSRALTSMISPKISLFINKHRTCHCPKDLKKYTGIVEDCCCDYETVDSINGI